MTDSEMIHFIKANSFIRLYEKNNDRPYYISYTNRKSTIYFWCGSSQYDMYRGKAAAGATYNKYYLDQHEDNVRLEEFLSKIDKIEKLTDDEYYTIWTRKTGHIDSGENYIKLRGKYYSARELEKLLDEMDKIKNFLTK